MIDRVSDKTAPRASLAAVLVLACAHTAPGPSPAASVPRARVLVSADNQPPVVMGVWAAYAVVVAAQATTLGHLDFAIEVAAREHLAESWKKARAEQRATDRDLDLLADVQDAGLMREYVLSYLARPGWTVSADDLARLDFDRWESWQRAHLPPDHRAATGAIVTGLPPAPVAGAELPGPEIDPLHSSCQAVRPALERALAAWERQERALPALPLSVPSQDQLVLAFKQAAPSPRAQRNGIVLVSPRVLNVAFVAGFCAVDRAAWPAAEALLRHAVALSPATSNVRGELVQALIMEKRLDEADAELDAALALPDTACRKAALWRKRGYILFDRGKLVDSYRAYAHSLDFDAASPLARSEMTLIVKTLRAAGSYDEKVLAPLVAPAVPNQLRVTSCPRQ